MSTAKEVREEGKDFDIYSCGTCFASVCSSLPKKEVIARMKATYTGISSGWKLAKENFKTGEPNPHPCEQNTKTHKHYLFVC